MQYTEVEQGGHVLSLDVTYPSDNTSVQKPPFRPMPEGWRPPTDYAISSTKYTGLTSGFSTEHRRRHRYGTSKSNIDHSSSPPGALRYLDGGALYLPVNELESFSNLHNRALNDLSYTDLDVGVSIAESKSTMQMVGNRAYQLYRLVRAAKRGDVNEMSAITGITARGLRKNTPHDLMLEFQLGWKPLLFDLKNAYDLYRKPVIEKGWIAHGGAMSTVSAKRSFLTDVYSWASVPANISISKRVERRVKYYGRVENPELFKAASKGLINPANILWELGMFTYLIDYVVPIGEFLNALDATAGLSYLGGYESIRSSTIVQVSPGRIDRPNYYGESFSQSYGLNVTSAQESYVRTALGGFRSPTVSPSSDAISLAQSANVGAVIGKLVNEIRSAARR